MAAQQFAIGTTVVVLDHADHAGRTGVVKNTTVAGQVAVMLDGDSSHVLFDAAELQADGEPATDTLAPPLAKPGFHVPVPVPSPVHSKTDKPLSHGS